MNSISAPSSAYRPGTIDPLKQRALRILKGKADFSDRHITDHEELLQVINDLRSSGCVIAFVTGVWDLFHIGHGDYLQNGKDAAAEHYPGREMILVAGYDSDALTKERKGPDRPIVPEDERARILGHIRAVDIITPQLEQDQLFNILPHDVRIVSESTKDLPDKERIQSRCAYIVHLPPQAEISTTARIMRLVRDGKIEALKMLRARAEVLQKRMSEVVDAWLRESSNEE